MTDETFIPILPPPIATSYCWYEMIYESALIRILVLIKVNW